MPSPDFARRSTSKYKLSISTTVLQNVLQCSKTRSRAAFSFFSLFFVSTFSVTQSITKTGTALAISQLLITAAT